MLKYMKAVTVEGAVSSTIGNGDMHALREACISGCSLVEAKVDSELLTHRVILR